MSKLRPVMRRCGHCGGVMHKDRATRILRCDDCGFNPAYSSDGELMVITYPSKSRSMPTPPENKQDRVVAVDVVMRTGYSLHTQEEIDFDD